MFITTLINFGGVYRGYVFQQQFFHLQMQWASHTLFVINFCVEHISTTEVIFRVLVFVMMILNPLFLPVTFVVGERRCKLSLCVINHWNAKVYEGVEVYFSKRCRPDHINPLKPTGHVIHEQFNIQQLYVLPTPYLCVLYLSENKQRLVPLTA